MIVRRVVTSFLAKAGEVKCGRSKFVCPIFMLGRSVCFGSFEIPENAQMKESE